MASAGSLAVVPLLAVAVILSVSGIHGRRTHDPVRATNARDILAPTQDVRVAQSELDAFFETGWVGWDVKTQVEIACGTTRAREIANPLLCLERSRSIVFNHQCNEERHYRTYTWLAWSSIVPALAVVLLGGLQLTARSRKKEKR
jgi:hypothetical protein